MDPAVSLIGIQVNIVIIKKNEYHLVCNGQENTMKFVKSVMSCQKNKVYKRWLLTCL